MLDDVAVYGAVVELAHAAGLTAVIDPEASDYATCAHVTLVVPNPRPVDEVVGLMAEALATSGFSLTRRPDGLMLRFDGTTPPPGCEGRVAARFPVPTEDDDDGDDAPPVTAEALDRGIRAVSDTEYLIAQEAVELFSQQSFLRSARVVPQFENGESVGLKVYGVRSASLLGRLGIQNGDTILTVNGHSLANPETALEAYSRNRDADRYEVVLRRRGEDRTHVYRIVPRLPRR